MAIGIEHEELHGAVRTQFDWFDELDSRLTQFMFGCMGIVYSECEVEAASGRQSAIIVDTCFTCEICCLNYVQQRGTRTKPGARKIESRAIDFFHAQLFYVERPSAREIADDKSEMIDLGNAYHGEGRSVLKAALVKFSLCPDGTQVSAIAGQR